MEVVLHHCKTSPTAIAFESLLNLIYTNMKPVKNRCQRDSMIKHALWSQKATSRATSVSELSTATSTSSIALTVKPKIRQFNAKVSSLSRFLAFACFLHLNLAKVLHKAQVVVQQLLQAAPLLLLLRAQCIRTCQKLRVRNQ